MIDTPSRTITKTITWRIIATVASLIIAFLISNDWKVAGSIASIQVIIHTVLYYLHERLWINIRWGKM